MLWNKAKTILLLLIHHLPKIIKKTINMKRKRIFIFLFSDVSVSLSFFLSFFLFLLLSFGLFFFANFIELKTNYKVVYADFFFLLLFCVFFFIFCVVCVWLFITVDIGNERRYPFLVSQCNYNERKVFPSKWAQLMASHVKWFFVVGHSLLKDRRDTYTHNTNFICVSDTLNQKDKLWTTEKQQKIKVNEIQIILV